MQQMLKDGRQMESEVFSSQCPMMPAVNASRETLKGALHVIRTRERISRKSHCGTALPTAEQRQPPIFPQLPPHIVRAQITYITLYTY